MLRAYLRDALHWMHLAVFKPLTLQAEAQGFGWKEALAIYFKVMSVWFPISLGLLAALGSMYESSGNRFDWFGAFASATVWELIGGLTVGLAGGLLVALSDGLGFGLVIGLSDGLGFGLGVGLGFGLATGLAGGLVGNLTGWFFTDLTEALTAVLVFPPAFLLVYLRPFYLLPHLVQYGRAAKGHDPFLLIQRSPLHWDEVIALPLPFLTDWLVRLANQNRERSIAEILFVAEKRPYQRRAAQRALLVLATQDLARVRDLASLARAGQVIKFIPAAAGYLPRGWEEVRRRITAIATLAQDHETRVTPAGQLRVLEDLERELESFRDAMALIEPPLGPALSPIAPAGWPW